MFNTFFKLFTSSKLKEENERLKQQLVEKQEHINATNKYWKQKMHEVKRKVKHVRLPTSEAL